MNPNEDAALQVFAYPPVSVENAPEPGEEASRKRLWSASIGVGTGMNLVTIEQKEQQIRQRAMEEGKTAARVEFAQNVTALRDGIGRTLLEFAGERDSYFHRAEEQVVKLALAIVRKILHRESQIDPLLLTGILRVALEKIGSSSTTKLRANPVDINAWRDYFTQARENFPTPELIGDPSLEPTRCILETELGTTEIGLETQLKEIDQGFLDLLAQRPGSR
jgi:flagellar assembly protein FliH